jgi:hypothetical protein
MAKRKPRSQIGNLTPDHYKSGIDPIPLRASGMQHTVKKLLTRATTLLHNSFQSEVNMQSYGAPKSHPGALARPSTPQSATSQGACSNSLLFHCFISNSHLSLSMTHSQTPWKTQMRAWNGNNGRAKSRGTLPSLQHFEG